MQHSPSWEANSSSDCPKIPNILWNPKVHYPIHNRPPLVPILSQIIQIYAPSYFLKINFNIIFTSMTGSSKWPLPLRFPHQNLACMSSFPYTYHIHQPIQYSWFSVGVDTTSLLHSPVTSPFKAQIHFPTPYPKNLILHVTDQVSLSLSHTHTHTTPHTRTHHPHTHHTHTHTNTPHTHKHHTHTHTTHTHTHNTHRHTHTYTHKSGKITVRTTILLTGNKYTLLFLQVQFTHKMY